MGILVICGRENSRKNSRLVNNSQIIRTLSLFVSRVIQGMEHVKAFYSYGDMPPYGKGPVQQKIRSLGRSYITDNFPLTDHFETCHVQRLSQQSSRKWPALWSGQDIQWSDVTAWILVLVVVLFVFLIWALLRLGLWRSKKRANKTS